MPGSQHALRLSRPAVELFLWSRALIWLAALLALAWLPHAHGVSYGSGLWVRWDSGWFLKIAQHGYASDPTDAPAFFPLYPGTVAVLGRIMLGHFALAGLVVSLVCCLIAFELLWRLCARHLGEQAAFRAVLYLAVFPAALFLQAVYSEALVLALALASFSLAEAKRWPWAGLLAGLTLLSSSTGVAVVAGLAVIAWPSRRALAWIASEAVLLFAFFPLTLQAEIGDPWRFVGAQAEWDRHFSPAGPFGGIWDALSSLGTTPKGSTPSHALAVNAESLVCLVGCLALLPLVWRWLGAAYTVFTVVALAIPLSDPTSGFPLLSLPRFILVMFPLFLVLAGLGARRHVDVAIVSASALLAGIAVVEWVTFNWVS